MAYFYPIVTKTNQDRPEGAASEHSTALNNYLAAPGANGKKRELDSFSTSQLNIGMWIVTTTILCCDEDDDD